jgi:hypothetical protein
MYFSTNSNENKIKSVVVYNNADTEKQDIFSVSGFLFNKKGNGGQLISASSFRASQTRFYSSATLLKTKSNLEPGWITGFIFFILIKKTEGDGEGCFNINIVKNKNYKTGFSVEVRFSIGLHAEDKPILELIKNNLNVGSVIKQGSQYFQFRLSSVKDLEVLINHLDKYPLLTQKNADYLLWKEAFYIVKRKEHLTIEGLHKIVGIKASLNWGLPPKLKSVFPDIVSAERTLVKNNQILDPNWIAGFTDGDGSFGVLTRKSSTHKIGLQVSLEFDITQHARDVLLFKNFPEFFNCGKVYVKSNNAVGFKVQKLSDITDRIIPFFKKYPIQGVKLKDFHDFCLVAELMKNKAHLTEEGLNRIRLIKAGMNTGRKFD